MNFNIRSFLKFCDCMHIKKNSSQAKLQVGRLNFHHNSNLDLKLRPGKTISRKASGQVLLSAVFLSKITCSITDLNFYLNIYPGSFSLLSLILGLALNDTKNWSTRSLKNSCKNIIYPKTLARNVMEQDIFRKSTPLHTGLRWSMLKVCGTVIM